MAGPKRIRENWFAFAAFTAFAIGFSVWTWLVFGTTVTASMDASSLTPRLAPDSNGAQLMAAWALFTHPFVVTLGTAGLAWWAFRRRLRDLSLGVLVGVVLAWGGNSVVKQLVGRERPPSPLDHLLTYSGSSYPSSHVAVVTAAAIMVIATTTTTRQSRWTILGWRIAGFAMIASVAYNRWVLNAHYASDLIGGLLFGGAAASLSLFGFGVHMQPLLRKPPEPAVRGRRVALIVNPAKVTDLATFRRHVEFELEAAHCDEPIWLETKRSDPGREMAREARAQGADLVLVAGGDGTVRVVASALAGTGIPVALIPAGTGNLLARNLGVPLDEPSALRTALEGTPTAVDLVKVTIDGDAESSTHFCAMAGVGIDAEVMSSTNADLKRAVGSAAYFIAAAQHIRPEPRDVWVTVDDGEPAHHRYSIAVVGNIGILQGGLQLIPGASATDGLLDFIIASPEGTLDFASMAAKAITRVGQQSERVQHVKAHRVTMRLDEPVPYELDGDTAGRVTVFEAVVVPGALTLMLPA